MDSWKDAFTQGSFPWKDEFNLRDRLNLHDIPALKQYLDLMHTRYALLKPYFENKDYPLVESRELLPSFESDSWEYKEIPGFSLVAFGRPINYFQEVFQFDLLPALSDDMDEAEVLNIHERNFHTIENKLNSALRPDFRESFNKLDVGNLENYSRLFPFLSTIDRAQVFSLVPDEGKNIFRVSGIYASFPSDLDTEIKRFGVKINKFKVGDNHLYDANRLFVYQFLMELYGFPIASERRTSAALFARRLHKMRENFLIRTLGQSDRALTTIWSNEQHSEYPTVEKIALIKLDVDQKDLFAILKEKGFFVDEKKRVLIIRITYKQHKFNADNVRQDRALSIEKQEVIHPLTGKTFSEVNILRDSTSMFLRLNDIIRGEYRGNIIYKRYELIENTDTDVKKLKFLYAWLTRYQRRIISYSDDFFISVMKVLDSYLLDPSNYELFYEHKELHQDVIVRASYIQQAHTIRILEDLKDRTYKGKKISYAEMLAEAAVLFNDLKYEVVTYFDSLVENIVQIGKNIINNKYLQRTYINNSNPTLKHFEIRKDYGKLVNLVDDFQAIRKARSESLNQESAANK